LARLGGPRSGGAQPQGPAAARQSTV